MGIALFIDVFAWFFVAIHKPLWTEGLYIVPLLALGNIFLGIYYNLSIWYKLTDQNNWGAIITLCGAALTVVLNIWLIPHLHYLGAALATFACYFFMMVTSYALGKKHYPVPYPVKKILAYLITVCSFYALQKTILFFWPTWWISVLTGLVFLGLFAALVAWAEKTEIQKLLPKKSISHG
ncbi:MAG: hypothetical protein EAZ62_09985 [Sphingobacteriia bacterium]|nr:MAG: hypothetical protein EAZ62_09985 [Sphingobacteriia bacterium]